MAVNKVEFGGETLIDLTEDSVKPETMVKGTTAHNAAGEPIEGTFDPDIYQTKENALLNIAVITDYPTTMSAIITAIEEAGGNVAQANFVSFTGYVSGFVSIKFNHYGGNTYKVECVDINNVTKIYNPETDNVINVSTTRIGDFLSYTVNDGLPEYTEENEGQFMSIVGGIPAWVSLPVAEDIEITIAEEITFNE